MKFLTFRTLLSVMLMSASLIFISCGDDDDNVDCEKALSKAVELELAYMEAVENDDCGELNELFDDLMDQYEDAKNCSWFKDLLEENEQSYSEFVEEATAAHEIDVAECDQP